MDYIKQWILAISLSSIICGIVLILSPKGSTGKAVRTAVSLVILCVILTPFTSGIKFEVPEISASESEESIKNNTVEAFKNTIEEKVIKILSENGFTNSKISINITTADNVMTIQSVKIIADGGNLQSAKQQIKSELGIEVEIEVSDE